MSFRVADEDPAYPPRSISTCLNFIKTSVSKWDSRSTAITEATEGDGELSSDDVSVEWTTLMGNPEPSEDDQIAVAVVSVRTGDGGVDERKVSFVTGALEMVAEAIPGA